MCVGIALIVSYNLETHYKEIFIMTKTELVALVAEKTGLTKKDSEKAVKATFEAVTEALVKGEKVQVVGFGSFEAKHRAARTALNPFTGKKIEVKETRVPKFTAGKALKDAVK